jgi:hypothetical protein
VEVFLHVLFEALRTKASRSGNVLKPASCENCGQQYEYVLTRTVDETGLGSAEAVGRRADAALERTLSEDCDPIPCPACGWYQAGMVRRLRRHTLFQRLPPWFVLLAITSTVLTLLGAVTVVSQNPKTSENGEGFLGLGLGGLVGVFFYLILRLSRAFTDPNRDHPDYDRPD